MSVLFIVTLLCRIQSELFAPYVRINRPIQNAAARVLTRTKKVDHLTRLYAGFLSVEE